MKYFYVHIGLQPNWLYDSIDFTIKNDRHADIFLCGDINNKINGVTFLNLQDIASETTKLAMSSHLWKHHPNPLWRNSIYRIFILMDMMEHLQAKEFVHFDSDVLIFHSFSKIKKYIKTNRKGLHITPCNNKELVFGYSYCNCKEKMKKICKIILKATNDNAFLKSLTEGHPNEMQILGGVQKKYPELITSLNTIPDSNEEYVFDPSSYGQYLFGTHKDKKAGWYGDHHWIGKLIGEHKLNVEIKDNIPYANKSKIVNLHIHSKQTGIIKQQLL